MYNTIIVGSNGQTGSIVKNILQNRRNNVIEVNRTANFDKTLSELIDVQRNSNLNWRLFVCAGGFCDRKLNSNTCSGQKFIKLESQILNVVDALRKITPITKCVYFSSARVYEPSYKPLEIHSQLCSGFAYSDAKLMMEKELRTRFSSDLSVVRIFNNHGELHFNRSFFIFKRLRAHSSDPKAVLVTEKTLLDCSWSFDLIFSLLNSNFYEFPTINCGTGMGITLADLDLALSKIVAEPKAMDKILSELKFWPLKPLSDFDNLSYVCGNQNGCIHGPISIDKIIRKYVEAYLV